MAKTSVDLTNIVKSVIKHKNILVQEPFISFVQQNDKIKNNKIAMYTSNIELPSAALKLRALRINKGLSMENIAKACNIAVNDLFLYELGKKQPTKMDFEMILDYLS